MISRRQRLLHSLLNAVLTALLGGLLAVLWAFDLLELLL